MSLHVFCCSDSNKATCLQYYSTFTRILFFQISSWHDRWSDRNVTVTDKLRYYSILSPPGPVELFLNWQLRLAAGDLVFNNIPTPRSWKADGRRHIPPNRLLLFLCLGPHASAPPV